MDQSLAQARRLRLTGAACAGLAAALLLAAIVLNDNAISLESGIVPDDAFGPYVMGIVLAIAAAALGVRSVRRPSPGSERVVIIASVAMALLAVLGAILAIGEPAVFNAGYGCLGQTDVWLAAAMRPTPATCGYLIPAADGALFYPAAFVSCGAAALGVACAILTFAGRTRRPT